MHMSTELLTPAQVAKRLRVSERTVYAWLHSGRLSGRKVGRRWRVTEDALAALERSDGQDDYDDPLTPEEAAESEEAWQAYLRGEDRGESLDAVREALLVERRA